MLQYYFFVENKSSGIDVSASCRYYSYHILYIIGILEINLAKRDIFDTQEI